VWSKLGIIITSKIKHAIKHKTSPARLAQCAVIGCKLKQNANEGCNSCAILAGLVLSVIACFILLVMLLYSSSSGLLAATSDLFSAIKLEYSYFFRWDRAN